MANAKKTSLRDYVIQRRKAAEKAGPDVEPEFFFTNYPQASERETGGPGIAGRPDWGVPEEDIYRVPAEPPSTESALGTISQPTASATPRADVAAQFGSKSQQNIPGRPPPGTGVNPAKWGTADDFMKETYYGNETVFPYGNPALMDTARITNEEWMQDEERQFEIYFGGEVSYGDIDMLDTKRRALWDQYKLKKRAELNVLVKSNKETGLKTDEMVRRQFDESKAQATEIWNRSKEKKARTDQAEILDKKRKIHNDAEIDVVSGKRILSDVDNDALANLDRQLLAVQQNLPENERTVFEEPAPVSLPTDAEVGKMIQTNNIAGAAKQLAKLGIPQAQAGALLIAGKKFVDPGKAFKAAKKGIKPTAEKAKKETEGKVGVTPRIAAPQPESEIPPRPPREMLGRSSFTAAPTPEETEKALQEIINFPKRIGLGKSNWRAAMKLLADISGFAYDELIAKPWKEIIGIATKHQKIARKQGL